MSCCIHIHISAARLVAVPQNISHEIDFLLWKVFFLRLTVHVAARYDRLRYRAVLWDWIQIEIGLLDHLCVMFSCFDVWTALRIHLHQLIQWWHNMTCRYGTVYMVGLGLCERHDWEKVILTSPLLNKKRPAGRRHSFFIYRSLFSWRTGVWQDKAPMHT